MFWGRGDTSQLDEHQKGVLDALRRMVETGHIQALSTEQTEVALRALNFYEKWEAAISVFRSVRNVLILIGGGLMFWWVTGGENFVTDFIRAVSENAP